APKSCLRRATGGVGEEIAHRLLAGKRRLGAAKGGTVEMHVGDCGIVCQHGGGLTIVRRRGGPLLGDSRCNCEEDEDKKRPETLHTASPATQPEDHGHWKL